jgi:hypothetical protein
VQDNQFFEVQTAKKAQNGRSKMHSRRFIFETRTAELLERFFHPGIV